MNHPLDVVRIKGYKSIRDSDELSIGKLNVLIGANGSGKSNFLSVFKLLRNLAEENLQNFVSASGGAEALLHFGRKTTSTIDIQFKFNSLEYRCTLAPAAGDTFFLQDEELWFEGVPAIKSTITASFRAGKETSLPNYASNMQLSIAEQLLSIMRSWRVYHFHDTSPNARIKQTADINDNEVLHPDASNLASILYLLQETNPDYFKRITDAVRLAAPFFHGFSLRPNPLKPDTILLRWRERGAEADFGADVLSDGTLRYICLVTLLLQPNLPSTILIDEPELGLHPYAITILASLLRSAATQTQVIVSTQSASLVNQFGWEDIIVVNRDERQSTFRRLKEQELESWLDDYGMGDLWEKNLLGGRPR